MPARCPLTSSTSSIGPDDQSDHQSDYQSANPAAVTDPVMVRGWTGVPISEARYTAKHNCSTLIADSGLMSAAVPCRRESTKCCDERTKPGPQSASTSLNSVVTHHFLVPVNNITGGRSSISPVARVTQICPSSPVISKNS